MTTEAERLQGDIDRRLALSPEDRRLLGEGVLPPSLRRGLRLLAGVGVLFALLGAAAGAVVGWNVHPWLEGWLGWTMGCSVAAGALAGGVIAFTGFRRRMAGLLGPMVTSLSRGTVRSEVLEVEVRTERPPGRPERLVLVDRTGRTFHAPAQLAGLELVGRFRVFYVELAVDPSPAGPLAQSSPRLVVALEPM